MTISFNLPPVIEQAMVRAGLEPATAFKEAGLIELYRLGRISHGELAEALGMSRAEADAVLRHHHVSEDLLTNDELSAQIERLRQLAG